MSDYTPSADALQEADRIIEKLKSHTDVDYKPGRTEIARMFDEGIWNGNWDMTTSFSECEGEAAQKLRDLRLVQEDEYDQHMDDGDEDGNPAPTHESMLFYCGAYVWFADAIA